MRKVIKGVLCAVLAMIMLLTAVEPVTAVAATNKFTTKTLAAGTTVSGTNGSQKYTIYKITTTKDGYLTFQNYRADEGGRIGTP